MSYRFIQASCVEGSKVDLRQSRVISRYKPDVVLFESAAVRGNPELIYNRYPPEKKPWQKLAEHQEALKIASQQFPYTLSDIETWRNIEALWRSDKNTLVFNVDAPKELRRDHWEHSGMLSYSKAVHRWQFWAYMYLRERYMSKYIADILRTYQAHGNLTVAVFLQRVHWEHVQFLLKNPSPKAVWKFYFGRFPALRPAQIKEGLKKESPVLLKYWNRVAKHAHFNRYSPA